MDTRTGLIIPFELAEDLKKVNEKDDGEAMRKRLSEIVEMKTPPTIRQYRKMKIDKYDPCPCGSEKKFKWCCFIGAKAPTTGAEQEGESG